MPVAIVTGASAGVGRAVAVHLARRGYRLGLLARDREALEAVRREIERDHGSAMVVAVDVADADAVDAAAQAVVAHFGRLDVWVNDAMETVFSFFEDMSMEEFHRATQVTYLGFVHGTHAALQQMKQLDRGCIVQIGSALAYRGIPLQSAYCGAKHAIKGFTESVRAELLHRRSGIRITTVDLPAVNTPQFDWARTHLRHAPRPMGEPVQPEVVARAVERAIRGGWREYWLGGDTLLTIIGNTVLPGVLDRFLAKTAVQGQLTSRVVSTKRPDNLAAPVHSLHRTRGSVGAQAADRAILIPGEVARVGVVVLGALVFLALGATMARRH
jgi:short-subunit dehydrogenase